mgnify:CR=1 FL=1
MLIFKIILINLSKHNNVIFVVLINMLMILFSVKNVKNKPVNNVSENNKN